MAIVNMTNFILDSKNFAERAEKLYNRPPEMAVGRAEKLILEHKYWCDKNFNLFSSPGRIEVSGNHTDHNNGMVIAAAVTVDTLAVVSKNDDNIIIIKSRGYEDVEVNLADIKKREEEKGTSAALVKGVIKGFLDRGYAVGGFYATTVSDVFKGAGMSSSASFEVLVSEILNDYYNGGVISAVEKAIISQYAENEYFGKPSGLMDQSAIALGGVSFIDFKDPKNPLVKKLDWNFPGVSAVVINCGGDHSDLTKDYADIRSDMESVAGFFNEKILRFVDENEFYNSLNLIKEKIGGRAIMRAMHYFEENRRVKEIAAAAEKGDKQRVFALIRESGLSSALKLKNLYPEGDAMQNIPLALSIAENREGVIACRVHGGGFAGTILTFVEDEYLENFVSYMSGLYGKENVFAVGVRQSGAVKIL